MKYILILAFTILSFTSNAQVIEKKDWCLSKCNLAGDEKQNTVSIFKALKARKGASTLNTNDEIDKILFPLRIAIVEDSVNTMQISNSQVREAISKLNNAFNPSGIQFRVDNIERINSTLKLEDLSANAYQPYLNFSDQHDKEDMISMFIIDHGKDFCNITPNSISCGKIGGFSYILSELTNNLVLSQFDLSDQKIVAHEFGHFFGLYHTFEEAQFGKDDFDPEACNILGDCLCDTPPDPGAVFEVHVNYSNCEMVGFKDLAGNEYRPAIENYMGYYKPCYLKEYSFTPSQLEVLSMAAKSEFRRKFSR